MTSRLLARLSVFIAGLLLVWCITRLLPKTGPLSPEGTRTTAPAAPSGVPTLDLPPAEETISLSPAPSELADLLKRKFNRRHVRSNEGILTFQDAAALDRFLARARDAGIAVIDRLDALHAVRIRVSDYDAFARELSSSTRDYVAITSNAILAPPTPPREDRVARDAVPVGGSLLASLGVRSDNSAWGRGVTIAVLDGGVLNDTAFGARLRQLDIGYGLIGGGTDGSHATSVAGLAAGGSADATGVAPSSSLLSIRVTGTDGASDIFSVARGIYAAVDAGASVINVSLGGYATSVVLSEAVDYALAANVAVVASAGNDQAAHLVWPAAYTGVVSVGAVDGIGRQAIFSNSGPSLQLTAPGYAIRTVGAGGSRVLFSGTSASAPVVAGSIAALLSLTPGLNALQAADLLATYSTDAGPSGPDPDYGRGTLNLDRALNRGNASGSIAKKP